jgi:hypothetical protein
MPYVSFADTACRVVVEEVTLADRWERWTDEAPGFSRAVAERIEKTKTPLDMSGVHVCTMESFFT